MDLQWLRCACAGGRICPLCTALTVAAVIVIAAVPLYVMIVKRGKGQKKHG